MTSTATDAGVPAPVPVGPRHRRVPPGAVLGAGATGAFLIGLDASAVNVAGPSIGQDLGGSTAGLQWTVNAYTLMFAALLLSAGAVSDRLGANRVFGVGFTAFTGASVLCGLAPSLGLLVSGRSLQGAGAALMMPSSLALIRQAFPDAGQRGRAIALWSVGGAVSTAAGPVLGGALTSALSWRSIFFMNLPAGLVGLAILVRGPHSPRRVVPLDPVGQLAAVVALGALTYGVIEGGASGFATPAAAGSLLLAVVAVAIFAVNEAKIAEPMVPLGLFRARTPAICLSIGFTVNVAFYGVVFVLSLFFQQVLDLTPLVAGLMFLPMTALIAVANVASGKAAARFGTRLPIVTGQLVCALGLLALFAADVDARTALLPLALLLLPVGTGLGFAIPSLTSAMLGDLPAERAGLAGGVLNAGRQTGGAISVAVFGVLVAQGNDFVSGLRVSLLIPALMMLATTTAALALPRGARQRERATTHEVTTRRRHAKPAAESRRPGMRKTGDVAAEAAEPAAPGRQPRERSDSIATSE